MMRVWIRITVKGAYRELQSVISQINNSSTQAVAHGISGPGAQSGGSDPSIGNLSELPSDDIGNVVACTRTTGELGTANPTLVSEPSSGPTAMLHSTGMPPVRPVVWIRSRAGSRPNRYWAPVEYPDVSITFERY